METEKWTQLWLDYHRVYQGEESWRVVLDGFTEGGPVIANALSEIKRGLGALIGVDAAVNEEEGALDCNGTHADSDIGACQGSDKRRCIEGASSHYRRWNRILYSGAS